MRKPRKRSRAARVEPPVLAGSRWRQVMDLNPDIKALVEPVIDRWRWLVPTWLHEMSVSYAPNIEGKVRARVQVLPQYRLCVLEIGPAFLGGDRNDRDEAVIHELLHLNLAPLQRANEILLGAMRPELDEASMRVLEETYSDALEATVVDLTNSMQKLGNDRSLATLVNRRRR